MRDLLSLDPETLTFRCREPVVSPDGARIELRYDYLEDGNTEPVAEFTETVELPEPTAVSEQAPANAEALLPLARLLSVTAGLSYYKAVVPATYAVDFPVPADAHDYLTELLRNGLAEFAYRNDLPRALLPEILTPQIADETDPPPAPADHRALVAVGGGKDSIVAIEALRGFDWDLTLFSVNSYEPIRRTAEVAELPLVTARRSLDPQLFELNAAGAYNGHVPVTAINSIVGLLLARRAGIGYVIFSNEASATYGNVTWAGVEVNHQWSKGIGFERTLHALAARHGVRYHSLLRPLTELTIMRRFADLTAYRGAFTSCNRAFQLDASRRLNWCGNCDKCRFVFLCLAPFLSRDELLGIFGHDLFADIEQWPGFDELLAADGTVKPFECVGEPSECRVALDLVRAADDVPEAWRPFLEHAESLGIAASETDHAFAFAWQDDHLLDEPLEEVARAVV